MLLGATRVIWIDDHFAVSTPQHLADLLRINLETARKCELPEFDDLFARISDQDEDAAIELAQRLADIGEEARKGISRRFNAVEAAAGPGLSDLSQDQINCVCKQLNIAGNDCWPFEGAASAMKKLCAGGDEHIGYIIDLNDAAGAPKAGLDLLKELHAGKSKATALLLTHEATAQGEATRERELREQLIAEGGEQGEPPVCVIAKERLEGEPLDNVVPEGLLIAIKRAGLRRSIHEVLMRAQDEVKEAFRSAMASLLQIPPEQLDTYVVDRAYSEGVSELHVVERALTASMSESFRTLFATDARVLGSAQRLRALRAIPLSRKATTPDKGLEGFRTKELWEPGKLVNGSYSPLACGDVFEFDPEEDLPQDGRMFILLVQPCDVTLRPDGRRDAEAGFFVPLKVLDAAKAGSEQGMKQPLLPFLLEGTQWVCDFRRATSARLSILDLSTLRTDGKVRYEPGSSCSTLLLPGQGVAAQQLQRRLAEAIKPLAAQKGKTSKTSIDIRCQLTLSSAGPFQHVANATYVPALAPVADVGGKPERFTWGLRRRGRVRMPYAASLLSSYLAVLDREAFDLDYLRPSESSTPAAPGDAQGVDGAAGDGNPPAKP